MKKSRSNQFDREWHYAQALWTAAKNNLPLPDAPMFQTYEREELGGGKEELVKTSAIRKLLVDYGPPLIVRFA